MSEAAVIIGASNGLGKAIAYHLASQGINCILASRNEKELSLIAAELCEKYSISVKVIPIDLGKTNHLTSVAFANACFDHFIDIRQVYLTAAIINDNDIGTAAAGVLEDINAVNYRGSAFLISAFSDRLKETSSNITVISSIAAIRPRGKNISYTASKIAMEYHVRGLQHFWANKPLRLQIYRVGYMDTGMSKGQKLLFKKADPEKVASYIIKRKKRNIRIKYYPRFWYIISIILNQIPWFIYKRIKF